MPRLTLTDIYGKDFVARYNRALSAARRATARLRSNNPELYRILKEEDLILTSESRSLSGYSRSSSLGKLSPDQAINNLKSLKARSSRGLQGTINLLGDNILLAAKRSAFADKLVPYVQRLSSMERVIFYGRHLDLFETIYLGTAKEIDALINEIENFEL